MLSPKTRLLAPGSIEPRQLTFAEPLWLEATIEPENWTGANFFTGVSCPSVALCVAVDFAGDVATSTDPIAGAGAWNVQRVDDFTYQCDLTSPCHASFAGVSCASVSLCVAVDSTGNVFATTDPTGGPSAWTETGVAPATPFPAHAIYAGVSCASPALCVVTESQTGKLRRVPQERL